MAPAYKFRLDSIWSGPLRSAVQLFHL